MSAHPAPRATRAIRAETAGSSGLALGPNQRGKAGGEVEASIPVMAMAHQRTRRRVRRRTHPPRRRVDRATHVPVRGRRSRRAPRRSPVAAPRISRYRWLASLRALDRSCSTMPSGARGARLQRGERPRQTRRALSAIALAIRARRESLPPRRAAKPHQPAATTRERPRCSARRAVRTTPGRLRRAPTLQAGRRTVGDPPQEPATMYPARSAAATPSPVDRVPLPRAGSAQPAIRPARGYTRLGSRVNGEQVQQACVRADAERDHRIRRPLPRTNGASSLRSASTLMSTVESNGLRLARLIACVSGDRRSTPTRAPAAGPGSKEQVQAAARRRAEAATDAAERSSQVEGCARFRAR